METCGMCNNLGGKSKHTVVNAIRSRIICLPFHIHEAQTLQTVWSLLIVPTPHPEAGKDASGCTLSQTYMPTDEA